MTDTPNSMPPASQPKGPELARDLDMLLITYVAYLLGFITGGLGALIGLVIAYMKRPEVVGTWRESHYTWLIRTFWIGLLASFFGVITTFILIGIFVLFATFVWVVIRLVKGWMSYSREEPIRDPENLFFG